MRPPLLLGVLLASSWTECVTGNRDCSSGKLANLSSKRCADEEAAVLACYQAPEAKQPFGVLACDKLVQAYVACAKGTTK